MTRAEPPLRQLLRDSLTPDGTLLVLTGAGISAESGIPTFRGQEGYWRIGSRHHHPMELATHAAFTRMPEEIWAWYLYRRGVCLASEPNGAHQALVALENRLANRFLLVTQNVDGLHLRAGSSRERTFEIHGNLHTMRCDAGCSGLYAIPEAIAQSWPRERKLTSREIDLLVCPRCQSCTRPHVLWFDESYDEALFKLDSTLRAAAQASLLIVVGTTGSTQLPLQVGSLAAARGAAMLVVNPEENPFTDFAVREGNGLFLRGTAGEHVPHLCAEIVALLANG